MGAMTAGTAATGLRAWLALRAPSWLTPARMRVATVIALGGGVLAAGTVL